MASLGVQWLLAPAKRRAEAAFADVAGAAQPLLERAIEGGARVLAVAAGVNRPALVAGNTRMASENRSPTSSRVPLPLRWVAVDRGPAGRALLAGVFLLMPLRADPQRLASAQGAVEWRLRSEDGAYVEVWNVEFYAGSCRVHRGSRENARTTIELGMRDFIALITGNGSPQQMFFAGRVRISGDLFFAASLAALLRVPSVRA